MNLSLESFEGPALLCRGKTVIHKRGLFFPISQCFPAHTFRTNFPRTDHTASDLQNSHNHQRPEK